MGSALSDILGAVGDPGAVGLLALLAASVYVCFLGCSRFRFGAGLIGLLLGADLAALLASHWGRTTVVVASALGGAALATLFAVFGFLGIFGLGALLAITAVRGAAAGIGFGPLEVVLAGLVGGFAGLLLRRFVAVVATALYGGLMSIAALFALVRGRPMRVAFDLMAHPSQCSRPATFVLCIAVLVAGGLIVQFRYGKGLSLERERRWPK